MLGYKIFFRKMQKNIYFTYLSMCNNLKTENMTRREGESLKAIYLNIQSDSQLFVSGF